MEDCMYNQLPKVDWSKAPDWATEYGTLRESKDPVWVNEEKYQYLDSEKVFGFNTPMTAYRCSYNLVEKRPMFNSVTQQKQLEQAISKLTSIMLLDEVKSIQQQRASEYEQDDGERSFSKIATVFNAYTGKDLLPSDVALIFEILKNVRFYAQNGLHRDSVIDKISYASLWGELVMEERE